MYLERHPAYKLYSPDYIEAPVLFESPHDFETPPSDFETACHSVHLNRQVDYYIGEMFMPVVDQGMPLLRANVHRGCVIDFNRALSSLHPDYVEGPSSRLSFNPASRYAPLGLGLVRTHAYMGSDVRIRQENPTEAEIVSKIKRYWHPYHSKIDDITRDMIGTFGHRYHISCHSFPMEFMSEQDDLKKAEVIIGTRHGTSATKEFTDETARFLESAGLNVLVNECLSGAECVKQHGQPHLGRESLQIEIVRELFMDNHNFQKTANYPAIQETMSDLANHLKDFALHRDLSNELTQYQQEQLTN